LSLIHGADGIGYYSYNYVTGKTGTNIAREQPELWRSVKEINTEVKHIGEFLLDGKPEPAVNVTGENSAVAWLAASQRGRTLLLLANTSAEERTVTVQLAPSIERVSRLDGSRGESVNNGSFKVTLSPLQSLGLLGE
jgi:hypothetical protein